MGAVALLSEHLMYLVASSRIMTRTTLDLDPSVLAQLKRLSREEGKSMGTLASELLVRSLEEPTREARPFRWPTRRLGQPRVDLEDKDAVWAVLDGRD